MVRSELCRLTNSITQREQQTKRNRLAFQPAGSNGGLGAGGGEYFQKITVSGSFPAARRKSIEAKLTLELEPWQIIWSESRTAVRPRLLAAVSCGLIDFCRDPLLRYSLLTRSGTIRLELERHTDSQTDREVNWFVQSPRRRPTLRTSLPSGGNYFINLLSAVLLRSKTERRRDTEKKCAENLFCPR